MENFKKLACSKIYKINNETTDDNGIEGERLYFNMLSLEMCSYTPFRIFDLKIAFNYNFEDVRCLKIYKKVRK